MSIRRALIEIVEAYDAYRARGVMPAPDAYQRMVAAIDAARPLVASRACIDCGGPITDGDYDVCSDCEDVFHALECSCHLGSVCGEACSKGKHHDGCGGQR